MRDEKEERKKKARSNKQGKATQHTHVHVYLVYMHIVDIVIVHNIYDSNHTCVHVVFCVHDMCNTPTPGHLSTADKA